MAGYRKLWWTLIAVLAITFGLLGYFGTEVYREAPPIPDKFMSTNGKVIATEESVLDGQTAWQSVGGMQLGSIWGHGAYQAPDWTADWLHRELLAWLDIRANEVFGKPYEQLAGSQQNQLEYELKEEYRTNTYDKASDTVILSERRIQAIEQTGEYYSKLFSDDPELRPTRVNYAMKENTLPSEARRAVMNDFFFWTAWAASTERFDSDITYTNNWPHETLIDNVPSAENIIWSIVSVILLIAGVGFLIWAWAFLRQHDEEDPVAPEHDPIA